MGDVVGMGGDHIVGPPTGSEVGAEKPKDHPYDVLSRRLTQAGAILHVLRMAVRDVGPADHLIDETCWAVNDLLEQAEAAAEEYDAHVKQGRP